ncbi:hypothetical protein BD311DRAFT_751269 [Dichomitus squalens]|uniref:Uncharacterized protein n=1 Tax=Dichomitus squalens TaxID=114155 RepID=A0A4Q9MVT0_9APHY|nr:hypothetical protein BD311DRAFT_751269 [Dichomitus squalens]TBU58772.1 hypothetical protein BD310DRAFT_926523 [Dichomitus squalens]
MDALRARSRARFPFPLFPLFSQPATPPASCVASMTIAPLYLHFWLACPPVSVLLYAQRMRAQEGRAS